MHIERFFLTEILKFGIVLMLVNVSIFAQKSVLLLKMIWRIITYTVSLSREGSNTSNIWLLTSIDEFKNVCIVHFLLKVSFELNKINSFQKARLSYTFI